MDKAKFETALGAELMARYAWAREPAKLHRFMESVAGTIRGEFWTWNHDGEACAAAWRTIGGKGKPTMKALRALPESSN
jgi:hypothetical protein